MKRETGISILLGGLFASGLVASILITWDVYLTRLTISKLCMLIAVGISPMGLSIYVWKVLGSLLGQGEDLSPSERKKEMLKFVSKSFVFPIATIGAMVAFYAGAGTLVENDFLGRSEVFAYRQHLGVGDTAAIFLASFILSFLLVGLGRRKVRLVSFVALLVSVIAICASLNQYVYIDKEGVHERSYFSYGENSTKWKDVKSVHLTPYVEDKEKKDSGISVKIHFFLGEEAPRNYSLTLEEIAEIKRYVKEYWETPILISPMYDEEVNHIENDLLNDKEKYDKIVEVLELNGTHRNRTGVLLIHDSAVELNRFLNGYLMTYAEYLKTIDSAYGKTERIIASKTNKEALDYSEIVDIYENNIIPPREAMLMYLEEKHGEYVEMGYYAANKIYEFEKKKSQLVDVQHHNFKELEKTGKTNNYLEAEEERLEEELKKLDFFIQKAIQADMERYREIIKEFSR